MAGGIAVAATDVDVAIARTEPPFAGRPAVTEIRALHFDAIACAQRHIFAENQYFTSLAIARAFARRLAEDDPPEIAVLSPYTQSGWLEISTMGVLRARIHRMLRDADHRRRYHLYCPMLGWLDCNEGCLNIHSKVLIVDDALLMIGSSNLSDRSLALDTECNLIIESRGNPRLSKLIATMRERLLAEHLGCTAEDVAAMRGANGLSGASPRSSSTGRRTTLPSVEPDFDATLDAVVPDRHLFDPERALDAETIVADLLPQDDARTDTRGRLIGIAAGVALLAAMALAWRVTPLDEWLAFDRLIDAGDALRDSPWAAAGVVLVFAAGGLVAFPLLVLIAATAMLFGPLLGPIYALLGALASATLTFAIGRKPGSRNRAPARRTASQRTVAAARRRGLVTVAFVRMLPIAPFSVVNVVAGASHIRWSDFLLGTIIGLLPGITTLTFFVDRAIAAIRDPGAGTFALLAVAVAILVALVWVLRRKLRRKAPTPLTPCRMSMAAEAAGCCARSPSRRNHESAGCRDMEHSWRRRCRRPLCAGARRRRAAGDRRRHRRASGSGVAAGTRGFPARSRRGNRLRHRRGPLRQRHGSDFGNAVLSRYPVARVRHLDLAVGRYEPRGALDVCIDVGAAVPLRVIATHLGLRPGERREQVRRIVSAVECDSPHPTLLMGDLNEWYLWGRPLRWLHAHFREVPAAPRTFPARRPLFALDRIWVSPRVPAPVASPCDAAARAASDHLPLLAEVVV